MKNIGGSLLPSSSPEILTPIKFSAGQMQVIPDEARDTYDLVFTNDGATTILASHPNGYSCRCLAERIAGNERHKYLEQAEYIVLCGGSVDFRAINNARISQYAWAKVQL